MRGRCGGDGKTTGSLHQQFIESWPGVRGTISRPRALGGARAAAREGPEPRAGPTGGRDRARPQTKPEPRPRGPAGCSWARGGRALGTPGGRRPQREEFLPAGGDGVQGAHEEPPPAAATPGRARLGPPAPLSGTGRSASAHGPRRPRPHPQARVWPLELPDGAPAGPREARCGGGRPWKGRDPAVGPRTWLSVPQWRRITASVRKATVHAAFSRAPRRPRATTLRRVRPRDAIDSRIPRSWGREGGKWGLGRALWGGPRREPEDRTGRVDSVPSGHCRQLPPAPAIQGPRLQSGFCE